MDRLVSPAAEPADERLVALGARIRAHRKALRVSATAAAESAGISRVTLHRIEKGAASVTIGAYVRVLSAIGLDMDIAVRGQLPERVPLRGTKGWIPARVRLADYPQLRELAWQVHGTDVLTPTEALGIYDRNERHLDTGTLLPEERDLIDALRVALDRGRGSV